MRYYFVLILSYFGWPTELDFLKFELNQSGRTLIKIKFYGQRKDREF